MQNLILGALGLIIVTGALIYFREHIEGMSVAMKIGIFSIIIALAGFTYTQFSLIGIIIYRMALVVCLMCVLLRGYYYIFKDKPGFLIGVGFMCLFLSLILQVMIFSQNILIEFNTYIVEIYMARNLMIMCILACVLFKAFSILFIKKEKKAEY